MVAHDMIGCEPSLPVVDVVDREISTCHRDWTVTVTVTVTHCEAKLVKVLRPRR